MKKLLLIVIVFLVGCQADKAFDDYLNVSMTIDSYFPTMSSVPGLPIELTALEDQNYQIEVSVDQGQLILWHGDIDEVGQKSIFTYEDMTIYWRPIVMTEDTANLQIKILNGEKLLADTFYMIVHSEDGYVLMQVVLTDT